MFTQFSLQILGLTELIHLLTPLTLTCSKIHNSSFKPTLYKYICIPKCVMIKYNLDYEHRLPETTILTHQNCLVKNVLLATKLKGQRLTTLYTLEPYTSTKTQHQD